VINAEFAVSAQALYEGVPSDNDGGTAGLFQSSLRPQPSLEPAVVSFDRVLA
jgi:hypothetical protein